MKNTWVNPGVVAVAVPVIPAVGYGLAYAFECGFCDVFEIPSYLIELSLGNILFAISTLIVLLAVVALIWYPYVLLPIQKSPKSWQQPLSYLAGGLLIVIVLAVLYQELWLKWVPMLMALVLMVVVYSIIPIFLKLLKRIRQGFQWIKKMWRPQLSEEEAKYSKDVKTTTISTTDSTDKLTKGKLAFIVFFATFFLFWFAFTAGQATAEKQDEFFVISDPENSVVLRMYGQNLICVPLDMESGKINGNIFMMRAESGSKSILRLEKIGRLGQQ